MQKVGNFFVKIGKFLWNLIVRIGLVFRDMGVAIWHGLIKIKDAFVNFGKRFMDSSLWTKIGHGIMGFGNFAHKQFVKGGIFLAVEVLFLTFMIASPKVNGTSLGGKAMVNFFNLGDYHGMPLGVDYDFDEEFKPIIGFEKGDDFEEKFKVEINKSERILNVLNALDSNAKDIKKQENDCRASDENPDKSVYDERVYQEVIYDYRYNTEDYYGFATYAPDKEIKVKDKALIWVSSENEIDFEDRISLTETGDLGIYEHKNADNSHLYLIMVKTTKRINSLVFSEGIQGELANAQINEVVYDTNYVNSQVDNSFLIMLFGIISFAILAIFIVIYNVSIASSYKADLDVREGQKPSTFIQDLKSLFDARFHFTLLAPAIVLLITFTVVPTILMILIAFTDMSSNAAISGQILINWSGFQNFLDLFGAGEGSSEIALEVGQNFLGVLTWTFEWAFIATFSCYFGGIFLALLINRKDVKCKKLWRTIFILTIAIPQFITLLVLRNLLMTNGPVNHMLTSLHIVKNPINFLQAGSSAVGGAGATLGQIWLARSTVLVINLYIGIPYTMLMTSGILMNIPADLYEAATIDGANKWQMFRKITLPYIIFVTTPYLISSFIGNITSFNTIFLTTGGGPAKASGSIAGNTDLLVTWLYKMTIDNYRYNAGSIIGILTFIITAFITLVCYRNSKAYKEEDTFQ